VRSCYRSLNLASAEAAVCATLVNFRIRNANYINIRERTKARAPFPFESRTRSRIITSSADNADNPDRPSSANAGMNLSRGLPRPWPNPESRRISGVSVQDRRRDGVSPVAYSGGFPKLASFTFRRYAALHRGCIFLFRFFGIRSLSLDTLDTHVAVFPVPMSYPKLACSVTIKIKARQVLNRAPKADIVTFLIYFSATYR